MDRYKYTEVLQEDGTYSTPMPIKVNAENVIFEDNDTVVVKLNQKAIKEIYPTKKVSCYVYFLKVQQYIVYEQKKAESQKGSAFLIIKFYIVFNIGFCF